MKIVLLSDLHLTEKNFICRKDDIILTQFDKLKFVVKWAKEREISILLGGDVFDRPRGYGVLTKCLNLFKEVDTYSIWGQHDMYFRKILKESNLGLLNELNTIIHLGREGTRLNYSTAVYGCSFGEEIPKIEDGNETLKTKILVIHAPIYDIKISGITNGSHAKAFLNKHKEFDLILCADIHQKFMYEENNRIICNTGCMLRKSVDIADHKPCFFVYDTETRKLEEIEIPYKPKDEAISDKHLAQSKYIAESLDNFITQIKSNSQNGVVFKDNLLNFIKENNIEKDIVDILDVTMEGGQL